MTNYLGTQFRSLIFCALLISCSPVLGQQTTMRVPSVGISDSFYEYYGIRWSYQGKGFFINNGGFGNAFPGFGGFDPNGAATFGFGGRNFNFNFMAGQGASRTMTSATPMITLPNGGMGSFYDTSVRPFVVGVVPVVGANVHSTLNDRIARLKAGELSDAGRYVRAKPTTNREPTTDSVPATANRTIDGPSGGAAEASTSTALRGDISVAEIRRLQDSEENANREKLATILEQAREQESLGKYGVAKIFYHQAAKLTRGAEAQQIQEKIRELGKR